MAKSVLVIDDDKTFCEFLVEILKQKGFQVTATTDGLAGYAMAVQDPYDLVIIDVRMPGVLGTELAESLKKEKPELKVILISAFADEPLARTAAGLGAPLVSKPFSANRLYEVIRTTHGDDVT
jgi:DNA-binding NtrC family response regulator